MTFVKFFVLDRNAVMIYNNTSMIAWYAKKAVSERNYRMKITVRLTALFIAVIMSVALLASCAGDVTDEKGFVLTLDNKTDTYTVTGYKSSGATDITLPSTYNGKAVTAIGKSAFFGSEILESVTIPDSIETVGALAFSNCKKLKKVTFDGNSKLKELDTGVFSGGKNVAVTVTSLVCGIILFVIAILLIANTYYQFCEKYFKISYGVVSIKIPYDSVLASAEEKLTKKLYLQTAGDKKKEFGIIAVNVNPIYNDDIVKEFEKRCDNFRKLNLSDDNKD